MSRVGRGLISSDDSTGSVTLPSAPAILPMSQGGTGQDTSAWTGMVGTRAGTYDRQQGTILLPAPTGVAATDTAAIVAAIAALPSSKGMLLFQTGTYKVNTSLDLTGLTGVVLQGLGYGTEITLGTTGTPGIDLTNSTRLTFRDFLITSEEGTAAPNVMLLMARPAAGTSSGWHQFHNCQFEGPTTGTTCKAVLYNYAAELCEWYGCRCYARNPSSVGLYYTAKNDLSVASSYETIATGEQSCVTLLWVGGHIVDYSAETTLAATPVYLHNCRNVTLSPLWMSTGGDTYIYCLSDGPGTTVDTLNLSNIRCEAQSVGTPKYFVYGDATNTSLTIGNIMGCIFSCSDAVVKQAGLTSNATQLGLIQGNNYAGTLPTYVVDVSGALIAGLLYAQGMKVRAYNIYGSIITGVPAVSDVTVSSGNIGDGNIILTSGLTANTMRVNASLTARNLLTANPGGGSYAFWVDGADANTVKYSG